MWFQNSSCKKVCGTHHDHQAEWIMRSWCFHYFTLYVKGSYMQTMYWWIFLNYIYHHTLLSHVCIITMYYIETKKGLYADDTHYIKKMGDIKKWQSVIPLQNCRMTENHQSRVAPRVITWIGVFHPALEEFCQIGVKWPSIGFAPCLEFSISVWPLIGFTHSEWKMSIQGQLVSIIAGQNNCDQVVHGHSSYWSLRSKGPDI